MSRKKESPESRREKQAVIFEAACRVIRDKGYHPARMADIAAEAGISYGLVYHYFKSKSDLFDALIEEWWGPLEAMARRLEAERQAREQARERVRKEREESELRQARIEAAKARKEAAEAQKEAARRSYGVYIPRYPWPIHPIHPIPPMPPPIPPAPEHETPKGKLPRVVRDKAQGQE